MLWEVEWGPKVKSLIAEEVAAGRPNPRLASRPSLRPEVTKTWNAYWNLSNARGFSEAGLQPITITDILSYVDLSGIPRGDPAIKLFKHIKAMDSAYLDWSAKKRANKSTPQPPKNAPRPARR